MKNLKLLPVIVFLLTIVFSSCQPKVDLEKEKQKILSYLETCEKAQIENDWETWATLYAENSVYIIKGEIKNYTNDELKELLKESFTNRKVKYTSFDNLSDPIIHISKDGSMAWYIVNYKFNFTLTDSLGHEIEESSISSSLFILEKENSKWVEVTGFNSKKPKNK